MKTLERKEDTRQKIQLGGLVKKAGLAEESKAVLLGIFLEAMDALSSEQGSEVRSRWRLRGDFVFTQEALLKKQKLSSFEDA